jgi:dihydrofolate reductase
VEPFSATTDKAFKASVMGLIDSVDTVILGANTYAQSTGWAYADGQGRVRQEAQPPHQVRGLVEAGSSPLGRLSRGDCDARPGRHHPGGELKEQSGKDIWLWGSLTLMRSLMDADIVDEIRMLVCPTAPRQRKPDLRGPATPEAARGHPCENGVVLMRNEIK